jgi:hypothetical protein
MPSALPDPTAHQPGGARHYGQPFAGQRSAAGSVPGVRRSPAVLLSAAAVLAAVGSASAGCGFVGAHGVSDTKPNGFVLRGHVTTPVPAGDTRADGAACAAPTSLHDVEAGAAVKVLGPDGTVIGLGTLGSGVIAHADSTVTCDFPFEIRAVPGGVATYSITVAGQHPREFPAADLREDKPAVIPLS